MVPEKKVFPSKLASLLSEHGDLWLLGLMCIGMFFFLLMTDTMIAQQIIGARKFWALFDSPVHGMVGLLVLAPFFKGVENDQKLVVFFCLAYALATLIDLDHFIAAGSLSIQGAISLNMRPPTHSLTFAIAIGLTIWLVTKNPAFAWVAFAALTSHVLRDASSGLTQILWPLPIESIPWWMYYLGEVLLLTGSYILVKRGIVI